MPSYIAKTPTAPATHGAPRGFRWTAKRKAEVLHSIRERASLGIETLEDALARHGLTRDEWNDWQRAYDNAKGENKSHALKITALKDRAR